jgi:precorrin-6B methylase 2
MARTSILSLAASRARNRLHFARLRLERKFGGTGNDKGQGFFDAYPEFFQTSTSGQRNRLNKRYRAIIEPNLDIIRGKSILDIASHDGRWTLAAAKAGAGHILGVEARDHLVKSAQAAMRKHGVPDSQVEFMRGDVWTVLKDFEPGRFDTVFCLGFFYHTLHHMELLNQIARLKPKNLILDTGVDIDPDSVIAVRFEDVTDEKSGAVPDEGSPTLLLVGHPTKKVLEMMLRSAGFKARYVDWHALGIKNWESVESYHEGLRVTVVATRVDKT